MDQLPNGRDPAKGDEFVHPSGTREVVYAVVDGTILTFREYPDAVAFEGHNGGANFAGINEAVASLDSPLDIAREYGDPELFIAEGGDDV